VSSYITYKFPLYPTQEQKEKIDDILLNLCKLYNWLLNKKKEEYKKNKKNLSKYDLINLIKSVTNIDKKNLQSQVMQNVATRIIDAYTLFFLKHNGYPKYKKVEQYQSFTHPQYIEGRNGYGIINRHYIKLCKFGTIKTNIDREILGQIKTATVKKERSGKYFIYLQVDDSNVRYKESYGQDLCGIDLGIEKFLTTQDGKCIPRPKFLLDKLKQLIRLHKDLSRKKMHSKNWEKARIKLACFYDYVANIRRDWHFKVAHWLVMNHRSIAIENCNFGFMQTTGRIAKYAKDVALGEFKVILKQLGQKYNCEIIEVEASGTSQYCSNNCQTMVFKKLSERTHTCPTCKISIDRDVNAARNIFQRAYNFVTSVGATVPVQLRTPVEVTVPGLVSR